MDNVWERAVTEDRIEIWKTTVEQELQELVQVASTLRKNITNSKTATKKAYYNKKFSKVQQDVIKMLTALQRLDKMAPKKEETGSPAEGDSDVVNDNQPTA
jgi:predicted transcriptional regulator